MRLFYLIIIVSAFNYGCRTTLESSSIGWVELVSIDTLSSDVIIVDGNIVNLNTGKNILFGGIVSFETTLGDSVAVEPNLEKYVSPAPVTKFVDKKIIYTQVDTSGYFFVEGIPPGAYTIRFSQIGMLSATRRFSFDLKPGRQYHLQIETMVDPNLRLSH